MIHQPFHTTNKQDGSLTLNAPLTVWYLSAAHARIVRRRMQKELGCLLWKEPSQNLPDVIREITENINLNGRRWTWTSVLLSASPIFTYCATSLDSSKHLSVIWGIVNTFKEQGSNESVFCTFWATKFNVKLWVTTAMIFSRNT